MSNDSLFAPLAASQATATIEVIFNGDRLQLPAAASVAAALLAGGIRRFRQAPVSGAARAPYCMMGVCHECLLEIDGIPDRQACLVAPAPGMRIRTGDRLPDAALDDHPAQALAQALAQAMEAGHGR